MKLISMTEFVLQNAAKCSYKEYSETVIRYARFLRQPLTLGMFVPVDEEGNVIDPESRHPALEKALNIKLDEEYKKAKEKLLFETDFKMDEANAKHFVLTFETIDNLAQLYEFNLTESAIKQIGL